MCTQANDFYNLACYISMSICQGGSGIPFLAQPVYSYLCTGKSTGITVDNADIPDPVLQFVVEKVHSNYMVVLYSVCILNSKHIEDCGLAFA